MTELTAADILSEKLLTETEAAAVLHIHVNTLRNYRHKGVGPRYVAYPGAARYRRSDLDAWITERYKND